MTVSSVAIAAPNGQSNTVRICSSTSVPSIFAKLPPSSAGVTNELAVSENTSVAPTARPGTLSGSVTRRNTDHEDGAERARGLLHRRIDLAERGRERQHHHRQEHVHRADDDGPFGVEQLHRTEPEMGERPVEHAVLAVRQDHAPRIGAHHHVDQQRRQHDHRQRAADQRVPAHHHQRERIGEQHRDDGGPEADPQRGHHHRAVEIDRGEPHIVRERRRGGEIAGCGLLIERVADHQPDRARRTPPRRTARPARAAASRRACGCRRARTGAPPRASGAGSASATAMAAPARDAVGQAESASRGRQRLAVGIEAPSRSPQDENWHANRKTSLRRSCANLVSSKRHAIVPVPSRKPRQSGRPARETDDRS